MRQDPDFFGDTELPLLVHAKKLKEALKLEETTNGQARYRLSPVEPDTYRGRDHFASERIGAFFMPRRKPWTETSRERDDSDKKNPNQDRPR